jgi:hypothetical protein
VVLLTYGRYVLWSFLAAAIGGYGLGCSVDVLEA